ncbi:hypothetical protein [Paractinoplanes rishiriensis]|uniref:Uncharacterized protein n=1 Tax=Paractinoplanes rishiriensis TaxID=1050105 RepID=A0A919MP14_9ACTN|nr:hypothetical protein [Actinoplanes rishiriensis]GIE94611.1 hypothetical protein Ari01nite_20760 [Actinoplanes rishiriensis]
MADETATAAVYGVQRVDQWSGQNVDIGALRYDRGHLEVVSADPDYRTYLADVVDTVNATEQLSIMVPPPPDAEQFSVWFRDVDRSAPDYLEALRTYLERDFDLILATESSPG